jgi:hypothetical protein
LKGDINWAENRYGGLTARCFARVQPAFHTWIADCGAPKSRYKNMRIPMLLSTLPAVALAIAFSPVQDLRAAAFVSPELRTQADTLAHTIAQKKMKPKKTKAKMPKAKTQSKSQ